MIEDRGSRIEGLRDPRSSILYPLSSILYPLSSILYPRSSIIDRVVTDRLIHGLMRFDAEWRGDTINGPEK